MYRGTLIDDLIKTVQQKETQLKGTEQTEPGMAELQLFMQQLQQSPNLRHIRVGVA